MAVITSRGSRLAISPLLKSLGLLVFSHLLASCGTIPGAGPFNGDPIEQADLSISIVNNSYGEQEELKFVIINATKLLLDNMELVVVEEQLDWPKLIQPPPLTVNVGDSIDITIYESKVGGLFIPNQAGVRPGNFIKLPTQAVDSTGTITVPYVGTFNVVGYTPRQISDFIISKIKNRAIEPEVVVSYGERNGSEVSVIGDVNEPIRFPLSFDTETILDAIARAQGPKFAGYDTMVTLHRAGKGMTIKLDDIIQDPSKNIFLLPNDIVYLNRQSDTYSIFGAARGNGRYEHERRKLHLSEALGNAGGLNNLQADASEVYVFRYLDRQKIRNLMLLENPELEPTHELEESVATVFRFNLRQPEGFFYTQNFSISNNDIIYVPDADTIDLNKFISILAPTTSTSVNARRLDNGR